MILDRVSLDRNPKNTFSARKKLPSPNYKILNFFIKEKSNKQIDIKISILNQSIAYLEHSKNLELSVRHYFPNSIADVKLT